MKHLPRHARQSAALADRNDCKVVHGCTGEALAFVRVEHPLEEPRKLFMGLKTMDGPVSTHSDRGDAIKFSDFVAIQFPSFVVLVAEEVRHLDFKCCPHDFPPGAWAETS